MTSTELVLTHRAWRQLRPLLLDSGFATGNCRRREAWGRRQLLVEDLEISTELPRGSARPPLDDWLTLAVGRPEFASPRALLSALAPRRSQQAAGGLLHRGQPAHFSAGLLHEDRFHPIDGLRVIGPRMLHVERTPCAELKLSQPRDSRTVGALGEEVCRLIRQSTVTLVGAGRNGSQLAWQLASLGIKHLRLIDPDRLEEHNLNAMPGLSAADIGQPKVTALAEKLLALRPDLLISTAAQSVLESGGANVLRQPADLIITCCDSDTPRLAAALVARETLTVHLDVGTSVQSIGNGSREMAADVRLLLPGDGCIVCVGGLADEQRTLYELAAPPGCLRPGPAEDWHTQRAGSLVQLNALAVGSAVQLWCDLLAGTLPGSLWLRLAWEPGRGPRSDSAAVTRSDACWCCRG